MGQLTPLHIVGYLLAADLAGARRIELTLHHQFRDEHVRDEWFRLTEPLVDYLSQHRHVNREALMVSCRRDSA